MTTYENWSFVASNNPANPEAFTNPNGTPQATFTLGPFGEGWLASTALGTRSGVWSLGLGGQVSLAIPNYSGGSPTSWKYVHVQVTYFDDGGFGTRPPTVSIAGATLLSTTDVTNTVVTSGPPQNTVFGRWITRRTIWLFRPCPASETVVITADPAKDALIDQIIVDTRCPTPGDGDVPAFQPCWRDQAGSTFQHWAFGVSDSPAAPESASNPYGAPQASMVVGPLSDGYILEDSFLGCRQGIWNLASGDTMTLVVPNNPAAPSAAYKYVRVQVTQYRDQSVYNANATVTLSEGTLVSQQQQTIQTTSFGATWVVHQSIWRLPTCPASESVVITGPANGSLIDQVVIDTLCLDPACPDNLGPFAADPGACSKLVTLPTVAVDGCKITSVVCRTNGVVISNPETFPVGTTPVVCTVTDGEGGTKTCNFTVSVTDNQAPTITCPANITVPRNPSLCGAIVTFAPTPQDNCPGATVTSTPASGSLFPLGLTTVTSTAHDAAGIASSPCTFTVRVIDFTGDVAAFQPCWRNLDGSTFQHWAFSTSADPPAAELVSNPYGTPSASLVLSLFSDGYISQDAFLGCRQGIWNLGSLDTMTLNIPNTPSAPPTAFKYVRVQVTQYRDSSVYNVNADVSITGATLVSQQQQTVETTAFAQWVVHQSVWRLPTCPSSESVVLTGPANGSLIDEVVVDTLCLDFTCPSDLNFSADPGQCSKSSVTWTVPVVDGCIVTNVTCTPPIGSTFPVGTHSVTCVIKDSEGGTKTCNFTVTVTDNEVPVPNCPANVVANPTGAGSQSVEFAALPTDNCAVLSTAYQIGATPITSPYVFPVGLTTVGVTVTDIHGNVSVCTFTVTVKATTASVVASSANPSLPGAGVHFTATLSVVSPGAGTPTGTVQFRTNGVAFGGPVPLSGLVGTSLTTALLSHGPNTVTAEYAGDANFLGITNSLVQVVNTAPTIGNDPVSYERGRNIAWRIDIATLIGVTKADAADVDGDPLTVSAVSSPKGIGATVSFNSIYILYTPPSSGLNVNGSDSFTYTLSDSHGGTVTGTINITVAASSGAVGSISLAPSGSTVNLEFEGLPFRTYAIQRARDPGGPWTTIATRVTDEFGIILYSDVPPYSPAFWRAVQAPLGSTVNLEFEGLPFRTYEIQRAPDLGGPWTTIATRVTDEFGIILYSDVPPYSPAYWRAVRP